jgi:hypothetical protein
MLHGTLVTKYLNALRMPATHARQTHLPTVNGIEAVRFADGHIIYEIPFQPEWDDKTSCPVRIRLLITFSLVEHVVVTHPDPFNPDEVVPDLRPPDSDDQFFHLAENFKVTTRDAANQQAVITYYSGWFFLNPIHCILAGSKS